MDAYTTVMWIVATCPYIFVIDWTWVVLLFPRNDARR
jgi:hypothetical protein